MVCKTSSRNAGYLLLATTKHGRLLGSGFENEAIWSQFSECLLASVVVRTKHGVQNQFSECWLFATGDNEAWKIAGQWV